MSPSSTMLTTSKRILIFSLAYYPIEGGAEIAVKEITDRIKDIEFDVITLRFNKTHLKKEKIRNCMIYRINGGLGYLSKVLFVFHAALFAFKLNQKNKYDAFWAIMTNMLFPIVLMRFLGNRTPYILTLQDGDPFEYVFKRLRIKVFLSLLKYGFRHADKIQAISNFLAGWAKQIGYKGEVEVIPNGVDIKSFGTPFKRLALPFNYVHLVTTSRLVKKNGIEDIIKALLNLSSVPPIKSKLVIFGEGPLKDKLQKLVKELNLKERVEFFGLADHSRIIDFFHQQINVLQIFVRPSLSEGFGSSFIEAMAAGLPVIATRVGGIPDFLKDYKTGLFCEVHNPKSIADKVMEYINNPQLTSQIVNNARKMVEEKYDWDLIASEMKEKIFDKV